MAPPPVLPAAAGVAAARARCGQSFGGDHAFAFVSAPCAQIPRLRCQSEVGGAEGHSTLASPMVSSVDTFAQRQPVDECGDRVAVSGDGRIAAAEVVQIGE